MHQTRQFFNPSNLSSLPLQRITDQMMYTYNLIHVKSVKWHDFRKLTFTNGAHSSHVCDAVFIVYCLQRLHTWHCTFDTQLNKVISK